MNSISKLRELIKNFKPIEDEDRSRAYDLLILKEANLQQVPKDIFKEINLFSNELIAIHCLCLLAIAGNKTSANELKLRIQAANDYVNLATILAGLKCCGENYSDQEMEQLTQLLPTVDFQRAREEIDERAEYYQSLKNAL